MQAVTVKILQHLQENKDTFFKQSKDHNTISAFIDSMLSETQFPVVFPALWGDHCSRRNKEDVFSCSTAIQAC